VAAGARPGRGGVVKRRPADTVRFDLTRAEAHLEFARTVLRARLGAKTPSDWERNLLAAGIDAHTADELCHRDARLPDIRAIEQRVNRLRNELARAERAS
jgi:hypothetical protein